MQYLSSKEFLQTEIKLEGQLSQVAVTIYNQLKALWSIFKLVTSKLGM